MATIRRCLAPPMTVPPKGGFTRSEAKGGFVLQSTYSTLAKAVLACTSLLGLNSTFKQASTSWNLRQFLTEVGYNREEEKFRQENRSRKSLINIDVESHRPPPPPLLLGLETKGYASIISAFRPPSSLLR